MIAWLALPTPARVLLVALLLIAGLCALSLWRYERLQVRYEHLQRAAASYQAAYEALLADGRRNEALLAERERRIEWLDQAQRELTRRLHAALLQHPAWSDTVVPGAVLDVMRQRTGGPGCPHEATGCAAGAVP